MSIDSYFILLLNYESYRNADKDLENFSYVYV